MLKPNFNPFFYGRFIHVNPEIASSEVDIHKEQLQFNKMVKAGYDSIARPLAEGKLDRMEQLKSKAQAFTDLLLNEEEKFSTFLTSESFKKMTPEKQREAIQNKKTKLKDKIRKFKEIIKSRIAAERITMSYENGKLIISGKELPKDSIAVDMPKVFKSGDLFKGALDYKKALPALSSAFSDGYTSFSTFNNYIRQSILSKIREKIKDPLYSRIAKYMDYSNVCNIKDLYYDAKQNMNIKVRVVGKASFDGNFYDNMALAKKRAKETIKKLSTKLGKGSVTFIPVYQVIGPKGRRIVDTQLPQAYKDLMHMWNNVKDNSRKVKSIAEMKKIVFNYSKGKEQHLTQYERELLQDTIDKNRNVHLEIIPPKKPSKLTIAFQNSNEKSDKKDQTS